MRHKCSRNGVLSFEALSLLLLIWHQVPVGALKSFGAKSREEAPQRDKIIGERQDGEKNKSSHVSLTGTPSGSMCNEGVLMYKDRL